MNKKIEYSRTDVTTLFITYQCNLYVLLLSIKPPSLWLVSNRLTHSSVRNCTWPPPAHVPCDAVRQAKAIGLCKLHKQRVVVSSPLSSQRRHCLQTVSASLARWSQRCSRLGRMAAPTGTRHRSTQWPTAGAWLQRYLREKRQFVVHGTNLKRFTTVLAEFAASYSY